MEIKNHIEEFSSPKTILQLKIRKLIFIKSEIPESIINYYL